MTAARGLSTRERSSTSSPSMPGITMSVTITSKSSCSTRASASLPFPAVVTRYPSADRAQFRMSWIAGSSSTTRIDAVIAGITFDVADRSPDAARTAGRWRTRSARRGSRWSVRPCEAPLGRDSTTIAACVDISELRLPSFSRVRNPKRRLRRRENHDPVPRNDVSRYSFVFKILPALIAVALPLRSRLPARSTVRAVHFGQGAKMSRAKVRVLAAFTSMLFLGLSQSLTAQFRGARDPGVRGGPDGAGDMLPNLTAEQQEMFSVGQADFSEEEEVDEGVGPRFNFVSCAGCHAQPAVGGSSPAANPLFRVNDPADLKFVNNTIPSFITKNGPVREARFPFNADGSRDGGVHALFVISGHP